jgi:hypothetical protein
MPGPKEFTVRGCLKFVKGGKHRRDKGCRAYFGAVKIFTNFKG